MSQVRLSCRSLHDASRESSEAKEEFVGHSVDFPGTRVLWENHIMRKLHANGSRFSCVLDVGSEGKMIEWKER
jgi:hypothetical protein